MAQPVYEEVPLHKKNLISPAASQASSGGGRIGGIQALRALAVILVAWFHSGEFLAGQTAKELPSLGVYGVDIFFVISGFIMSTLLMRSTSEPGVKSSTAFLMRRLTRIYPIYWIFSAFTALFFFQRHTLFTENYLPSILLLPWISYPHYALLISYGWTLIFEVIFYSLIAVVTLFTTRRAVLTSILLICAFVLIGMVVDIRRPVLIVLLNPLLLEFVLGCVIALIYQRFGVRRQIGLIFAGVGIVTAFLLQKISPPVANGMQMAMANEHVLPRVFSWGLSAAFLVCGVVLWSPTMKSRVGRVFTLLGDSSYSAYLGSVLALELTIRAFLKLLPHAMELPISVVFLSQVFSVAIVLLVGLASYKFIERPMLTWIHENPSRQKQDARVQWGPSTN